ncbi:MAG: carotenoid biosynthesis protein [Ignavibacteriales bacterium]|nr:carotenoid biosynthesis protein [Ignavibacteriales bacterium]
MLGTGVLYLFFVCGGLWNVLRGYQSFMQSLFPIILFAIACAAFLLTYKVTIRNVGVGFSVVLMTFIAEASGANFGFPFGDYAFTNALGPKLLDVPLVIPFLWLGLLITSWIAADRILRYKHVVVAAIVATAFDAVVEFAADSLDLWHWQGGMPTELNFISWFAIAYLGIFLLRRYATEKEADPIVPHLLIVQLLYFFICDIGIRFVPPQA